MADIKSLERDIKALKKELKKQEDAAKKARRQMVEKNKKDLKAYEASMYRAIAEHDAAAKAQYDRLLNDYRTSINNETAKLLADIGGEYAKLAQNVADTSQKLNQKMAELEAEAKNLRDARQQKNDADAADAREYLQEARDALKETDALPHEKFEPNRLKIYAGAVGDGQNLYDAALYEAAMAVAVSAKTGIERLRVSVEDKLEDWDDNFTLFKSQTDYLMAAIRQELPDWEAHTGRAPTDDAGKKARLAEIDFWCRGEFEDIVEQVRQMATGFRPIGELGKTAFLKTQESPDADQLKEYIEKGARLKTRLERVSALYKARFDSSCRRCDLAIAISNFLTEEINLTLREDMSGYRPVTPEAAQLPDFSRYAAGRFNGEEPRDEREYFRIAFENAAHTFVYIYIIPVESGLAVAHAITVYVDVPAGQNPGYAADITAHIEEAVRNTGDQVTPVTQVTDAAELRLSPALAVREIGKDIERLCRTDI